MGWIVFGFTLGVYLLTMARTVSFWDCGEFIATSHSLGVCHPPGAPLYTLLAHLFCLLAPGPQWVALCSNLLSALASAFTAAFLFWTLHRLLGQRGCGPALVGALCYAFCDTAWFSAVESEVYALAMLIASAEVYSTVRWSQERSPRWLLLIALLAGLGACTHELTLLVLPAVGVALLTARGGGRSSLREKAAVGLLALAFFIVGLSPYLMVPLRAQAQPYLNNTDPSTPEAFHTYISRAQYEHAPLLYPRIWRQHPGDEQNYLDWGGHHKSTLLRNVQFFVSYQFYYMFLRYWLENFAGRHFWELLWLPLLLGIIGMGHQWKQHRRTFWPLATLALFSGLGLAVYLNMPAYQPRERDYAFVLSFYAFALWIGYGAQRFGGKWTLLVPLLMLGVNYAHNDRSHNTAARDVAWNILHSCEPDALLLTTGDNDTYPLWYLQQVEQVRTDVRIVNLTLLSTEWYARQTVPECTDAQGRQLRGSHALASLLEQNLDERPVYLTHYTERDLRPLFPHQLGLTGNAFRLCPAPCEPVLREEALRHLPLLQWNSPTNARSDITERRFHQRYLDDVECIAQLIQ